MIPRLHELALPVGVPAPPARPPRILSFLDSPLLECAPNYIRLAAMHGIVVAKRLRA